MAWYHVFVMIPLETEPCARPIRGKVTAAVIMSAVVTKLFTDHQHDQKKRVVSYQNWVCWVCYHNRVALPIVNTRDEAVTHLTTIHPIGVPSFQA
jgi:hypothetical protein